MSKKDTSRPDPADLRCRAEERLGGNPADLASLSAEESRQLLHEFRVHQIELEMQNDELRRVQQEHEASHVKYFFRYDMAPVGYFTVSEKGLILDANLKAAQLLGVEMNRLVKQPLTRYIVPEDRDIYYLHRKRLQESGAREVCDLRMRRQDGSPFWARFETSTARDGEEGPLVWRLALSDMTDRHRVEEENRKLEQRMRQTQKLESLGVLVGGIAHDFNNLLMVILGHAELAQKEISPISPARRSLTEITTATRRAAELSLQMLAYAGKATFTLERSVPPIEADPGQIREIVMNLLINASEAIGDRSGVITVSVGATRCDREYLQKTELHDDHVPGRYVYLEVTDTGSGMDAETKLRIFEPFFSTKFTGRGLGLAAVRGIVRAHKGR